MDEQIKPILKEETPPVEIKKEEPKKDIINNLPDWNIEPPLEIKRGNE